MYCRNESLETIKSVLAGSPADTRSLFHELGFAIVKNNLALRCPGFPPDALRGQYEQMLGSTVEGKYVLDLNGPVDPGQFDLLGHLYERMSRANGTRKKAGEFFTPPFVVDYMVSLLGLDAGGSLEDRKIIDIACGPGAFLVAGMRKVIRSLTGQGMDTTEVIRLVTDNFYGLDISRTACDICEINMYSVLLDELGPYVLSDAGAIQFNVFRTNAIDNKGDLLDEDTEAARIKRRRGKYAGGFDYILGNPPYLEAKKMPVELKETCRESWPEITGAFDLYIPFVLQCNRLVSDGGKVCLILPDKFTVARYAKHLRQKLLRDFSLLELADLSGMDVFSHAMVYPAVIAYENSPPARGHRARTRLSVRDGEGLAAQDGYATVPQELYGSIGSCDTLFCLPGAGDIAGMLRRIFHEGTPIGRYVHFRSAVSFHQKGLREQFVRRSFDGVSGPVQKYLGGLSYAKRNEVGLFRFHWEGYHINYDREALKKHGNVLPPLTNFKQEKIVFCQHAPRITAGYDATGEFVTKDVYPIGIVAPGLTGSTLSLKYLTALLNSELMSFVYGTVYKGIQIGGGYYHYLPTWIDVLPVVVPGEDDVRRVEGLADGMIESDDFVTKIRLMGEVDEIVYRAYDISSGQQALIRKMVPAWNPQVG